jgi:thiol-disulfide isomerase/thioredoxin
MKHPLFLLLAFLAAGCASLNKQVISHEGEPILLGKINQTGLEKSPYSEWFNSAYREYAVDQVSLNNADFSSVEILTFMGTWCSDSQREVPHLYKILDAVHFKRKKMTVIAVDNHPDRRKTSPGGEEKGWNIEYVPTFIVLKNGREIGRIVESPMETLEKDLVQILAKK